MILIQCVFTLIFFAISVTCSEEGNKVLLMPYIRGSHYIHYKDVAAELIRNDYNVSILIFEDSKKISLFDGLPVHFIYYPGLSEAEVEATSQKQAEGKANFIDSLKLLPMTLKSTKHDATWIPYLRSQQFDLLIKGHFPGMDTYTRMLEIPHNIMLVNGLMDQLILGSMVGAPCHSTMQSSFEEILIPMPKEIDQKLERSSFSTRFKSLFISVFAQLVFKYGLNMLQRDFIAQEYSHLINMDPLNDLIISTNVEGVFDQPSLPPHMKTVYPLSKSADNEMKPIPENILSFMDQHQKIILLGFGSTFKPSKEFLEIILNFQRANTKYGLIISLKKKDLYAEQYDLLTQQQNILVLDWLPQKELLQSGRISIFHSHGGFNSVMESMESGVPMIITPLIPSDQQGNCKRISSNGYGFCMPIPTLEQLSQAIQLFEKNDYFRETMKHVKRVIELKKQDPQDLVYWVKQVLEVGTEHLVPKDTVQLHFLQLRDIDIHFAFFLAILLILVVFGLILRQIFRCLCSAKKVKEKNE